MDFNTLADLRYIFAKFRDGEKLTAACLHYLGDAHQLFAQKKEMEAKHDVIIELAFHAYKRGRMAYTPQIITQGTKAASIAIRATGLNATTHKRLIATH